MNEESARKIFGSVVQTDGSLKATDDNWIEWPLRPDGATISIDGCFTADQLEALAWWIRNIAVPVMPPDTLGFRGKSNRDRPVAEPGGPTSSFSDNFPVTGHRLGSWPRIRDLPVDEQATFTAWLGCAKRPRFDDVAEWEQDGYFPWDWEEWFYGSPGPWV